MDASAMSDRVNRHILSTADIPHGGRATYWREGIENFFPGLAVDWMEDTPIHARAETRVFAGTHVTEILNTPAKVSLQPPTPGGDEKISLVLQLAGKGLYHHAGRETLQEPCDLVLLDMNQSFVSSFPNGLRVLVWGLPKSSITPMLGDPERVISQRIQGATGFGAVLREYVRSLALESDRLDPATQHGLLTHLCGLVGLAIEAEMPPRPARSHNYRTFQRQRILAYIEAHLRDPRLTAKRAARDLGMSVRWLHALLEDMADGFADLVARRRLEQGLCLLEDPAWNHLSIAEIAFLSGFNDLSTFYRRFGERYGTTPGEARRRAGSETRLLSSRRSSSTSG